MLQQYLEKITNRFKEEKLQQMNSVKKNDKNNPKKNFFFNFEQQVNISVPSKVVLGTGSVTHALLKTIVLTDHDMDGQGGKCWAFLLKKQYESVIDTEQIKISQSKIRIENETKKQKLKVRLIDNFNFDINKIHHQQSNKII